MNKIGHLIVIILAIITPAAAIGSYFFFSNYGKQKTNDQLPTYTIGISLYKICPSSTATLYGFIESMNMSKKAQYKYKIGKGNGNKLLVRSLTEEFIDTQVDLIFSIGANCSQLAKELTNKRSNPIPIVFGGVKDPADLNLVDSEELPGGNATGVTGIALPWATRIAYFLQVRPTIKNAIIPCSHTPGSTLEKDIKEITQILHEKNVNVRVISVYSIAEFREKVLPFLTCEVDVVFLLRDGTSINCMDALVKICNREKITIFSTYLEGVEKGAAFGFGTYEKMYGIKSAELAQAILEQGISPGKLPVKRIQSDGYKLQINSATAEKQGLQIDPKLLFFIKNAHIIS